MLVEAKDWRKRDSKYNWQVIRTQVLKLLSGAGEGKRGGCKGNVRRGATAREAMEESRYLRVIEGEGVRRDDPIEYFLPTGVKSIF